MLCNLFACITELQTYARRSHKQVHYLLYRIVIGHLKASACVFTGRQPMYKFQPGP